MTTIKPRGRYDYCASITDRHTGIITIPDFECELDIDVSLTGGQLDCNVSDVLVGGVSLLNGDPLSRMLFGIVANMAEEEIETGGWLFDQVSEAEGLSLTGHPGDPDAHWSVAAE